MCLMASTHLVDIHRSHVSHGVVYIIQRICLVAHVAHTVYVSMCAAVILVSVYVQACTVQCIYYRYFIP